MSELLQGVENVMLMGPGPSCVPQAVYDALAKPTLGHLDGYFIKVMDEIKEQLKVLFNTQNQLTIPMSGTGSAGMETCFVNLIEKGDKVLVLKNGVFGMRMEDVAGRLGAEVEVLEFEWGTPVVVETVAAKLAQSKYDIVAVVHAETSTGVVNPVAQLGALVKDNGALFLVDAVTSLGGMPVEVDAWNIDAIYSGTQKCLSCPPGLAPVSFSDKAVAKIKNRSTKVPNWYLDLSIIISYWEGAKRAYHHTAPVNMLYGMYEALHVILEEGVDKVFARHQAAHEQLLAGLQELGLSMYVAPEARLPMLNAITIPEGADDMKVRTDLRKEYKIEIGAGLGPLAGKIWRIGLMGHTARPENVDRLLAALKNVL
jgi:alanine-glyoxylate transaminase/serine-glyoxylate transaminase/serine-pyruvate transaminase